MKIDNTPAIRAFAQERIKQFESAPIQSLATKARVDELKMIVTLCDGLEKQSELLTKALGL